VPGAYNIAIMKAWIWALAVIAATSDVFERRPGPFGPDSQAGLERPALHLTTGPSSQAAANSTLTAIPGIKVGHYTLAERPTGCTVVLIEQGATAGVDVRGAAPATRDTDLLNPTRPT
jgi:hypothetical protein